MADISIQPQTPTSPEAKGTNWYSRLSIICGIAGFFLMGTANIEQRLQTTSISFLK